MTLTAPLPRLPRLLITTLLAAASGLAAADGLTGEPVDRAAYVASARQGAERLAARHRFAGAPRLAKTLILAPVALTFEFQDHAWINKYSQVEAWWVDKEQSGDFKLLANEVQNALLRELRTTHAITPSKDALRAKPELDAFSQPVPFNNLGKGRMVMAFDYRDYDHTRSREILAANPGHDAILFVQVRTRLRPVSLASVEGVPSMNYWAYNQVAFRLCGADNECAVYVAHQPNADANDPADQVIPIPRASAKDNPKFKDANAFARQLFADSIVAALRRHWGALNKP
jgi:hypothetical protein